MRPKIEAVCQTMAADLILRVMPAVSPTYHQGTVGMIASMLSIMGEEWDRAASRRVEENDALRKLFRDAASYMDDSTLKRRFIALADTGDHDLHISALEKNNSDLRAALIELHSHIETQPGPDARRIEAAIWKELLESTRRRRLSTAQF